jgi:inorganic phosphate transporter, PiT family
MAMLAYATGAFLGWSLGANDAANTFGTAVSSRMVSFRQATLLIALCAVAGAALQGGAGMETLQGLTAQDARSAWLIPLAAGLVMTLMTACKLPASASQATVGAILGAGLARNDVHWGGLGKIALCWATTPLGAAVACIVTYRVLAAVVRRWRPSVFVYDPVMRAALVVCGCYGAYALGANNVANIAAVLAQGSALTDRQAALFGGICIALGAVTFSRGVMSTVGRGTVRLDVFSALCSVLSLALVVHAYAALGVPVSTSQGMVGALLGIGWVKGMHTVHFGMLARIAVGWLVTPLLAAVLTFVMLV